MTFGGLVPLILVNLVLMVITATAPPGRLNAGNTVAIAGDRDVRHRLARRP